MLNEKTFPISLKLDVIFMVLRSLARYIVSTLGKVKILWKKLLNSQITFIWNWVQVEDTVYFQIQSNSQQLLTTFVMLVTFTHTTLDMLLKATSIKHASGLILEKQRCRLWQLTIGKNYYMTLKISILPFPQEKLNSIY